MFKINNSGPECPRCIDLWGFRTMCIIVVGLTIGWIGMHFVAIPPSVALLAESRNNTLQTGQIIVQLGRVEKLVKELQKDVQEIKRKVGR